MKPKYEHICGKSCGCEVVCAYDLVLDNNHPTSSLLAYACGHCVELTSASLRDFPGRLMLYPLQAGK